MKTIKIITAIIAFLLAILPKISELVNALSNTNKNEKDV